MNVSDDLKPIIYFYFFVCQMGQPAAFLFKHKKSVFWETWNSDMLFLFPVSSAVWNAISWDKNKHNLAAVNIETHLHVSFSRREHLDCSHFNFYHSYQIDAVQAELVHHRNNSDHLQYSFLKYFIFGLYYTVEWRVTRGAGDMWQRAACQIWTRAGCFLHAILLL